jgi:methylphosphotriester-DNA--protein-cysteine methyltransferase
MSPKSFLRINRFERIINNIERVSRGSFTTVTYDNNYYDQTHFIKDFKLFTGSTPIQFLNQRKSIKQIMK